MESIDILYSKINGYKYVYDIYPDYKNIEQYDCEYDDNLNNANSGLQITHFTEPNGGKKEYIDHILQNITVDAHDKLFAFTKLSLNCDCCELYMYVTAKKEKIASKDNEQYVLLAKKEKEALWIMK